MKMFILISLVALMSIGNVFADMSSCRACRSAKAGCTTKATRVHSESDVKMCQDEYQKCFDAKCAKGR